ncbi:YceI family protein [Nocardia asteroides]|uniref:YceI family protein n=1 Tax=Nocardia asteroides TaxID=1824 RepID=UPI00365F64A3
MNDGRWKLDPGTTYIGFRAHAPRGRLSGHFQRACGSITWTEEGTGAALLEIHAPSISTGVGVRDQYLCAPAFLDVRNHPLISFQGCADCRGPGHLTLAGKLTLRGVSAELQLDVGLEPDGTRIIATTSASIDLATYGISAPLRDAGSIVDLVVRGHLTPVPPEF